MDPHPAMWIPKTVLIAAHIYIDTLKHIPLGSLLSRC